MRRVADGEGRVEEGVEEKVEEGAKRVRRRKGRKSKNARVLARKGKKEKEGEETDCKKNGRRTRGEWEREEEHGRGGAKQHGGEKERAAAIRGQAQGTHAVAFVFGGLEERRKNRKKEGGRRQDGWPMGRREWLPTQRGNKIKTKKNREKKNRREKVDSERGATAGKSDRRQN